MNTIKNKLIHLLFPGMLLAIWEFHPLIFDEHLYFPKFSIVFQSLLSSLTSVHMIEHLLFTLFSSLSGLFIASLIAIPLGLLIGKINFFSKLLHSTLEFFRPLPAAAIIPVAVLFFGIDMEMKLFVVVFGSAWPILLNTIDGVKGINPMLINTAKIFDLNKRDTFLKVVLPAALPAVITGVKISLAIALILSITVEMIMGNRGMGFYIIDAERSFNFAAMYSGIFVIGIIGLLTNYLFSIVERKVIFWHLKK